MQFSAVPALVNLQLCLHVTKKVHLKLHVNLQMKINFMWSLRRTFFLHIKVQLKVHLEAHLKVKKIPFDHFKFSTQCMCPPRACYQLVVIPIENVVRFSSGTNKHWELLYLFLCPLRKAAVFLKLCCKFTSNAEVSSSLTLVTWLWRLLDYLPISMLHDV